MAFEALAEAAERWCARTPFQLIAAEETERRMDFYAEPGVSFYVLCPEAACGDNFVSDPRGRGEWGSRSEVARRGSGEPPPLPKSCRLRDGDVPGAGGGPRRAAGPGASPARRESRKMESAAGAGRPRGQGPAIDPPSPSPDPFLHPRTPLSIPGPPFFSCPPSPGGAMLPAWPPLLLPPFPGLPPRGAGGLQGCHGKWRMGRDKMESG